MFEVKISLHFPQISYYFLSLTILMLAIKVHKCNLWFWLVAIILYVANHSCISLHSQSSCESILLESGTCRIDRKRVIDYFLS